MNELADNHLHRELFALGGVIKNESRGRTDRTLGSLWNTQEGYMTLFEGLALPTKSLPPAIDGWE